MIQVLPTQLIPDDNEGKVLRVRMIQKEGVEGFDPVYLYDEGSTISWIPCGRKLTCSYPGIKFFYGPDTYYGNEVGHLPPRVYFCWSFVIRSRRLMLRVSCRSARLILCEKVVYDGGLCKRQNGDRCNTCCARLFTLGTLRVVVQSCTTSKESRDCSAVRAHRAQTAFSISSATSRTTEIWILAKNEQVQRTILKTTPLVL